MFSGGAEKDQGHEMDLKGNNLFGYFSGLFICLFWNISLHTNYPCKHLLVQSQQ